MKLKRIRQEEANARNIARNLRGDSKQLAQLIAAGHGHSREAQRLTANAVVKKK